MLLDRADQAISSTELQKNTRMLLDHMADGSQDRYVVIRDNRPTAVVLSVAYYEALMNELVALDRMASLKQLEPLSHTAMLAHFDADEA
jgi:antitoxin StbD